MSEHPLYVITDHTVVYLCSVWSASSFLPSPNPFLPAALIELDPSLILLLRDPTSVAFTSIAQTVCRNSL